MCSTGARVSSNIRLLTTLSGSQGRYVEAAPAVSLWLGGVCGARCAGTWMLHSAGMVHIMWCIGGWEETRGGVHVAHVQS